MRWEAIQAGEKPGAVVVPGSWVDASYYDGFNALFRIENALRVFVYVVLKSALGAKFHACQVQGETGTIGSIARQRIQQDRAFGYLGYSCESPFVYLGTGELVELVVADGMWQYFKPYFDGTQEVIRVKLRELCKVRNSLAHFRPVRAGDIEYAKEIALQILPKVEDCLTEIYSLWRPVAGTLAEKWKPIEIDLIAERTRVELRESQSGRWSGLVLSYDCPVWNLRRAKESTWFSCSAGKLVTPAFVASLKGTSEHGIAAYEYLDTSTALDTSAPTFTKTVTYVYDKHSLEQHWDELLEDWRARLQEINAQSEGVRDGSLVKGSLIEAVSVYASKTGSKANSWEVSDHGLRSPTASHDPVEYWGEVDRWGLGAGHLLTLAHRYPWMTVDVAKDPLF